ncbi:MAG: DUF1800 family protein [Verrucomicrobiota bacterium]
MTYRCFAQAGCAALLGIHLQGWAQSTPSITSITVSNGQQVIRFTPYPAAEQFNLLTTGNLFGQPFQPATNGALSGYQWSAPATNSMAFYRLEVVPMSSNAQLTATVLNRLAYGPTPDLLERVLAGPSPIGPDAYLAEQLAPEAVTENAANTHTNISWIEGKFAGPTTYISSDATSGPGTATINDLRAWLVLHAVGADRQLLEVLTQFLENHFVTQYSKTVDYFGSFYNGVANMQPRLGTEMEWREVSRWREALLNPQCTFKELLTISAESPAMIIYLDTVNSRGDGGRIPNENYSREIMELFAMGVDNGYDQSDIVAMAPCWTGWSVEMVETNQAFNPFAPKATTIIPGGVPGNTAYTNLYGVWAFNFRSTRHATYAKAIFIGKTVPARFGEPYVSKLYGNNTTPGLYELVIPARTGTNGIQDGYDIVAHLADLPFTQEYMCVKLCRLLVHEDFAHGYDFTDPNLSEEGQLVRQCMAAWENSSPKGQIRPVLATIFNSALFRSQGSAFQKVKTPLEYAVSAVRALRSSTNGSGMFGTFTAQTDGYALVGTGTTTIPGSAPLSRMGGMYLFERSDPDGYPEVGTGWISAGTLAERLRFIQSLMIASGQTGKSDGGVNNVTDPVSLLRSRLPNVNDQRDAATVADFFVSVIYPGEGKANLDLYRAAAIDFLNRADNSTSSPFSALTPSNTAGNIYDTRVRGMVAMLLTMQRFQEQ